MKINLLLVVCILHSLCCKVSAQAYYMHEAAEDSDGSLFGGILGALFLFGIIYMIGKCAENYSEIKKEAEERKRTKDINTKLMEERLNDNPRKYQYQNNPNWREGYLIAYSQISTSSPIKILWNKTIDDLIIEYQTLSERQRVYGYGYETEEAKKLMRTIGYYQYLEWNNEGLIKEGRKPVQIINTQCHHLNDIDFRKECIKIYGDYAEVSEHCIIIFEDGMYRIIPFQDRRYEPLKQYVSNKHPDRVCIANQYIGGSGLLSFFFAGSARNRNIPKAKQMENHGILENKFLGSCYFALMAYYGDSFKEYGERDLHDFLIYLGLEDAVYLHKMLKKPLSPHDYYRLKIMDKLKMSAPEYINYGKHNAWQKKEDGIYNEHLGFLGKNYEQACETLKLKFGFSFDDVKKEVENIVWHL